MKKHASAKKSIASRAAAAQSTPAVAVDRVVGEGAELHLELPGFEGPFDLLLHLIEEHELDILNIPIAFVTEHYLRYLALMQELNIDVASDYLVMAATLAHMKSRLLLPTPPADDDADGDEAEQDPRSELIRRLLEYQKYKQAAEQLASRSVLGRDTFTRGSTPDVVEGPAPLAPIGIFKLLEAFERILARAKTVLDHHIEFERLSITERINQLVDKLRQEGALLFDALFEGQRTRAELIVTFLALLEMTRLRLTNVRQDHPLAPIFVELAVAEGEAYSDQASYLLETGESVRNASATQVPTQVESFSAANLESATETDVQSSSAANLESATETDVQSSSDAHFESATETDVQSSSDAHFESATETDVDSTTDASLESATETVLESPEPEETSVTSSSEAEPESQTGKESE